MSETTLQAIVVAGLLVLCLGLPLSLVLTMAGKGPGPVMLRISLLLAGLFISFAMVLGMGFNAGFANAFSSLQESQWRHLHNCQLLACLPILLGLLSFFSGIPALAWLGRAVVYVASPLAAQYIGLFDPEARSIPWAIFYLGGAIFCWEVLLHGTRRPRNQREPLPLESRAALP